MALWKGFTISKLFKRRQVTDTQITKPPAEKKTWSGEDRRVKFKEEREIIDQKLAGWGMPREKKATEDRRNAILDAMRNLRLQLKTENPDLLEAEAIGRYRRGLLEDEQCKVNELVGVFGKKITTVKEDEALDYKKALILRPDAIKLMTNLIRRGRIPAKRQKFVWNALLMKLRDVEHPLTGLSRIEGNIATQTFERLTKPKA